MDQSRRYPQVLDLCMQIGGSGLTWPSTSGPAIIYIPVTAVLLQRSHSILQVVVAWFHYHSNAKPNYCSRVLMPFCCISQGILSTSFGSPVEGVSTTKGTYKKPTPPNVRTCGKCTHSLCIDVFLFTFIFDLHYCRNTERNFRKGDQGTSEVSESMHTDRQTDIKAVTSKKQATWKTSVTIVAVEW